MYRVEFAHSAAKELERLYDSDRKLYSRMLSAIESLRLNPHRGKLLKGRLKGDYSLRVGSYRIIYTIHKDKLVVCIIDLGHRREIYRIA